MKQGYEKERGGAKRQKEKCEKKNRRESEVDSR